MKKILYILILMIVSVTLFAQTNKSETLISIKGTSIKNIGEVKDIWDTGSAIYLSYENISSNQFSYMFQTGYMQFKENPENDFQGQEANLSIIPLQVGGRYYILINSIRPFLMAMSGINIINSEYPIIPEPYSSEGESVSNTDVRINFQVGLGLALKLFSNLQIEVLANYNSHILDAPTHYNLTGLELGVGLNWVISN